MQQRKIKIGDKVSFDFRNSHFVGIVVDYHKIYDAFIIETELQLYDNDGNTLGEPQAINHIMGESKLKLEE